VKFQQPEVAKLARNLTQQLVHDLGQSIVRGQYRVGEGLPSEADICTTHGVSRSATREAVKMLSAKGLLSSRPRQGIRVLPETNWNMFDAEVLQWLLNSTLSKELLMEFAQMRQSIEPNAAALAATSATPEQIENIEHALQRMADAETGLDDPLESDIQFHSGILVASGNRFFARLCAFTETALRVSIRFTNKIKGVAAADVEAHANILRAIKNGNAREAKERTLDLLAETVELIRKGMN
jgi:DNA-binding FadR family transcriptional regulator